MVDSNPVRIMRPLLLFLFISIGIISTCLSAIENDSLHTEITVFKDQLKKRPFALNGYWDFYPNELINSEQMSDHPPKAVTKVPHWWVEESGKPSVQFATYRLKVILSEVDNHTALALYMPEVYSSYDVWVNGTKLGQNGIVGNTKTAAKPQWKPSTYSFTTKGDTIEIILHLSNFYHHRTGTSLPILLGYADQLIERENTIEAANLLLLFGIVCLSLVGFIYFVRLKKIAFLFYALLCMAWMFRSAFSNHYQIVQWFPDINWYLCARVEYISIYLSTLFGSLLVGSLFPRDVNKVFRRFFIITCACFALFTLIVSPFIFTAYVQLYLGLSSILLISILVIVIKAYVQNRDGAGLLLFTAFLAVGTFGYVILSYQGLIELNELVFNIIFLIQFILTLITVIWRVNKMDTTRNYDFISFDEATKKR